MRKGATGSISATIAERKGVSEIEKRCCMINWVFRERGHSDFGIDADIEESVLEGDEYHLTNRHIAIQIKSGDSYIKFDGRKKQYYFTIDSLRHANYWLGSDRPVIVMVYEEPKDDNGESACPDKDNLLGTVYWAQIKLSNLEKVKTRASKKDNSQNKGKAKHAYAKVYLTEKFTRESASDFSNIISSYMPTYDSDLDTPSVLSDNHYIDILLRQIYDAISRTTSYVDDILMYINPSGDGISDKQDSLFWAIENFWLNLYYNRNIDNLLISRYLDTIRQYGFINQLDFDEFKVFCNQGIIKLSKVITDLATILTRTKQDLSRLSHITESQNSLIHQTIQTIDDYIKMLRMQLASFPIDGS